MIAQQEKHQVKHKEEHQVNFSDIAIAVLKALDSKSLSRKEMFAVAGVNGDSRSFKRHIESLITDGFVEMTVPDKPNSKLQKYRLTEKGTATVKTLRPVG